MHGIFLVLIYIVMLILLDVEAYIDSSYYTTKVTSQCNLIDIERTAKHGYFNDVEEKLGEQLIFVNGKEVPLSFVTSDRLSHQLISWAVAIYLKQRWNYTNLELITVSDTFNLSKISKLMDPIESVNLENKYEVSKAMINLEIWIPPFLETQEVMKSRHITPSGALGSVGYFGWFMPTYLLNDKYMNHWRSFVSKESPILRIFSRTDKELQEIIKKVEENKGTSFTRLIYTPEHCVNQLCAILFAKYEDDTGLTRDDLVGMISEFKMYVKVVWIGKLLNETFIQNNMYLSDGRSLLISYWYPSTYLMEFNFSAIAFPPCTPFIASVLNKVKFSNINYESILEVYSNSVEPRPSLSEIACDWLKDNWGIWDNWRPFQLKKNLMLIGIFPIKNIDPETYNDPALLPAFSMAVDDVNNSTQILKDFFITKFSIDGSCDINTILGNLIKFFKVHSSMHSLIGIVGPACSDTVEPVSGALKEFNVPLISYGAEGAIFSKDDSHPYFFRTIPEHKIFKHVYLGLLKKMDWRIVVAYKQAGRRYNDYLVFVSEYLQDKTSTQKLYYATKNIKDKGYYIVIGDFYKKDARQVICDAYKLKMTGKQGFVWFLPHWYPFDWYKNTTNGDINCTTEEMEEALEYHLSLSYEFYAPDNITMQANITIHEWKKKYSQKLTAISKSKGLTESLQKSDYGGFAYDAVWLYAYALERLFQKNQSYIFDLRSDRTIKQLSQYIRQSNFTGVSGQVYFPNQTENSRLSDIIVRQFQKVKGKCTYVEVGRFKPDPNDTNNYGDDLKWYEGKKPTDGRPTCAIERFRIALGVEKCDTAIAILCTMIFSIVIFVFVIVGFICKRRYDIRLEIIQKENEKNSYFLGRLQELNDWEIPRENLIMNRILGEGEFGKVYGGECFVGNKWEAVAVKVLRKGSNISDKLDFLSEAETMKNLQHPNIVALIGVVTNAEPYHTIMEFMLYGDLQKYLMGRYGMVSSVARNYDNDEIGSRRLTHMALDVARGLNYLEEMKYVHRDLACRNCLVNGQRTVKIADFGLTRPMCENSYYRLSRKGMVPIRWMAPESITEGIFTTMSDIWSYGVLLFEIITFGARPYNPLSISEVAEHVKKGHHPKIPSDINPLLADLLKSCWRFKPLTRIEICRVIEILESEPYLVTASLPHPKELVAVEGLDSLDICPSERKTSIIGGSRLPVTNRNRSLSGNAIPNVSAPLAASVSDDGISKKYDHQQLGSLQCDDKYEDSSDPLLAHGQYISRYLMNSNKDGETLIRKSSGDSYNKESDVHTASWTNVTPV